MAKYFNNKVKTGKLAGSVFAVRFGETIERAYNPIVNNPSTAKQIEARASLKLLSQLATVVSPYIAMPRQGAVSPRNRFVSENYKLVSYANMQADINLNAVQLTKSVVSLPAVAATRSEYTITARLQTGDPDIDRMVYVLLLKQNNELRVAGTRVISERGSGNENFVATFNDTPAGETVVLAYGVRDNTEAARVSFGDMETVTAEQIAKLVVTRALTDADITLTHTQGITVPAGA